MGEQALGGYWRVPAYALVAAAAAFLVSFAFKSQYPAVARLIVRTGETSYATTDSGATLGNGINIGGIDLTKQQTLGNTLVNLALSSQSAEEIVDRVGVERINGGKEPSLGLGSKIVNFLKVGGTGTAPTAKQAAVDEVRGSLEAVVLDESWIMEITAWNPDPKLAAALAAAAADVTVDQSAERFTENSRRELDYLNGELKSARSDLDGKQSAVSAAQAKVAQLGGAPDGAPPDPALPQAREELASAKSDLELAQGTYSALSARHSVVAAMVDKPRFDASRLGEVLPSTTPGRPLRYLFLLVGALVGALAGLLVTWFRKIHDGDDAADHPTTHDEGGPQEEHPFADDVVDVRDPPREPVAVLSDGPSNNGPPPSQGPGDRSAPGVP